MVEVFWMKHLIIIAALTISLKAVDETGFSRRQTGDLLRSLLSAQNGVFRHSYAENSVNHHTSSDSTPFSKSLMPFIFDTQKLLEEKRIKLAKTMQHELSTNLQTIRENIVRPKGIKHSFKRFFEARKTKNFEKKLAKDPELETEISDMVLDEAKGGPCEKLLPTHDKKGNRYNDFETRIKIRKNLDELTSWTAIREAFCSGMETAQKLDTCHKIAEKMDYFEEHGEEEDQQKKQQQHEHDAEISLSRRSVLTRSEYGGSARRTIESIITDQDSEEEDALIRQLMNVHQNLVNENRDRKKALSELTKRMQTKPSSPAEKMLDDSDDESAMLVKHRSLDAERRRDTLSISDVLQQPFLQRSLTTLAATKDLLKKQLLERKNVKVQPQPKVYQSLENGIKPLEKYGGAYWANSGRQTPTNSKGKNLRRSSSTLSSPATTIGLAIIPQSCFKREKKPFEERKSFDSLAAALQQQKGVSNKRKSNQIMKSRHSLGDMPIEWSKSDQMAALRRYGETPNANALMKKHSNSTGAKIFGRQHKDNVICTAKWEIIQHGLYLLNEDLLKEKLLKTFRRVNCALQLVILQHTMLKENYYQPCVAFNKEDSEKIIKNRETLLSRYRESFLKEKNLLVSMIGRLFDQQLGEEFGKALAQLRNKVIAHWSWLYEENSP